MTSNYLEFVLFWGNAPCFLPTKVVFPGASNISETFFKEIVFQNLARYKIEIGIVIVIK